MGLLVYKVADYSFTAEREQYRAICEMLKKHFIPADRKYVSSSPITAFTIAKSTGFYLRMTQLFPLNSRITEVK